MINKRLINIKNLLRICISVLVIGSMLKSCVKAYTFNEFSSFVDQVQGQSTNSNYVNEIVNAFKGSKNAIINLFANNNKSLDNYTYFAIARGRSSAIYTFYVATNDIVTFIPSGNYGHLKYDPYGLDVRLTYSNNTWNATFIRTSNDWISNQGTSAFIGLNKTSNYSGNYNTQGYNKIYWWVAEDYNPTNYLEYNNLISETTHNGNLITNYTKGNLYNQSQIKIGEISPNDSYYYEAKLYNYKTNSYIGNSFVSLNVQPPIFYNDNALYINENQEVFVNTINLDYSTQYRLDIVSYYGQGGTNLYEDDEWYIFLPYNAIISGDVITSLGSGEFTTQDSTIQIIESINNIIGGLPVISGDNSGDGSGDLSSGFDGGSGILGGIFSLFVPDGSFFRSYFSELNTFFSDRLGILYFPFEFIIDFFNRVLNIDFSEPIMVLGPYTLPLNDDYELVPQLTFDFNSYLEEPHVKSIHDIYLVIMDGLLIFGYIQLLRKTYEKMVNKGG